jgi:hypothetical protein
MSFVARILPPVTRTWSVKALNEDDVELPVTVTGVIAAPSLYRGQHAGRGDCRFVVALSPAKFSPGSDYNESSLGLNGLP